MTIPDHEAGLDWLRLHLGRTPTEEERAAYRGAKRALLDGLTLAAKDELAAEQLIRETSR
jgi:hypothetical protein